jgi:penicillin-binding protein 1C
MEAERVRKFIGAISSFLVKHERKFFVLFSFLIFFQLADILFPLRYARNYSTTVEAADGTVLYAFLSNDDKWRMYTKLDEITQRLQKTIIYKEDKWFYWHFGFNPVAMVRAFINNTIKHRRTSGASTITMQVARLLEPKERTYRSKFIEIFRALQLEWNFSKKEILQLYLNLVPYGSNIEGIKSASYLYFGKNPSQLSLAEVTALSIIPNRPTSLQLGKNNDYISHERNRWLKRFRKDKLFPDEMIQDALDEPLIAYRHAPPKYAPHFCLRLKQKYPTQPIIATHLRYNMQLDVEYMVKNYAQTLAFKDIHNVSVIVLDNRKHEVITYVGSPDFNNNAIAGQVDGVKAIRSPGSTLKPLIYGLAFEKGIYTPKSVVTDVPVNVAGYAPENYDESYRGKVTVSDALAQSLNIPAVKTLDAVHLEDFLDALETLNFEQIQKDKNKLGLSVALGGCGVRLEELAGLYSIFSNEGNYYAPSYIQSDAKIKPVKIISPTAAYMVAEILTKLRRYDLPNRAESVLNLPKIAWKTGTSYGRRDAWSIGFNGNYVVGIWTGNFDGKGVPELTGADIATPLLLQIFNAIDKNTSTDWIKKPKELQYRLVCSESGDVPQDFCGSKVIDEYIPGVSHYKLCQHLKKIWVSADSSISYCSFCLPQADYIEKYYPNYAPELLAYYESNHIPYPKIPPHNPACKRVWQDEALKIVKPTDGITYYVDMKNKQELELLCQASGDVETVSWFVNGQFAGSTIKTQPIFITPQPGELKITCTDDKGRSVKVAVTCKAM